MWNCTIVEDSKGNEVAKIKDYNQSLLEMKGREGRPILNKYESFIVRNRISPKETGEKLGKEFPELIGGRVIVCAFPAQAGYGYTIT